MAMIAVPLSNDISRLFTSLKVDGKRDPSDHITMFYLGEDYPINKICKMIPVIYEITSNIKPFEVQTNKITSFPGGDHGYPVIAQIKSDTLKSLRADLKQALEDNKLKFVNTYPDYKPHVTLAYADEKPKDITFETVKWNINISIFGGNETTERLYVSFPFGLALKKKGSYINEFAKMYKESVEK